jgi:hypothetical protein
MCHVRLRHYEGLGEAHGSEMKECMKTYDKRAKDLRKTQKKEKKGKGWLAVVALFLI